MPRVNTCNPRVYRQPLWRVVVVREVSCVQSTQDVVNRDKYIKSYSRAHGPTPFFSVCFVKFPIFSTVIRRIFLSMNIRMRTFINAPFTLYRNCFGNENELKKKHLQFLYSSFASCLLSMCLFIKLKWNCVGDYPGRRYWIPIKLNYKIEAKGEVKNILRLSGLSTL